MWTSSKSFTNWSSKFFLERQHLNELRKYCRMPTHKYVGKMSQKSEVEQLGVYMLDPSSNHGLKIYHLMYV